MDGEGWGEGDDMVLLFKKLNIYAHPHSIHIN